MTDTNNGIIGTPLARRRFLTGIGGGGLGLALGGLTGGLPRTALASSSYGALIPDPNGLVDLPEGFQYRVLGRLGDRLSDGTLRPGASDGMGAFPGPNNTTILCLNHEQRYTGSTSYPVPHVADDYDPNAVGGTSIIQVGANRKAIGSWVSSSGTVRNCAGGVTPWNTWITVEENEDLPGSAATKSHGWAFEVDPSAPLNGGTPRQIRLDALGRFYKEAVVIDPATRVVYQTEDQADGFFYRFVPTGMPDGYGAYAAASGVLEALSIPGLPDANAAVVGTSYSPVWLAVPDPDGIPTRVRYQTYAGTPTKFFRGEGAWWSTVEHAIYFDATGGGASGHWGQIWRYVPATNTLTLVYKSTNPAVLEMPDNLLVLPWGDVVLCEDGPNGNYVRILTRDGNVSDFARNAFSGSEFAGACFGTSPDTLYVNIQGDSISLAIWGPWARR